MAFSQGSLLENWIERIGNFEPLSCPIDCHQYFITMEEAGFVCLVAAFLTSSKDIVVPSFSKEGDLVELQLLLEQILSNYNYNLNILKMKPNCWIGATPTIFLVIGQSC